MYVLLAAGAIDRHIGMDPIWPWLSRELWRRNHRLIVYVVGWSHREIAPLRYAAAYVVDDLACLPRPPDVVHGLDYLGAIVALLSFPGVPGVCSALPGLPWESIPAPFPRLSRYLAHSDAEAERLVREHGLRAEQIDVLGIGTEPGDHPAPSVLAARAAQIAEPLLAVYQAALAEHHSDPASDSLSVENRAVARFLARAGPYYQGDAVAIGALEAHYHRVVAEAEHLRSTLERTGETVGEQEREAATAEARIQKRLSVLDDVQARHQALPSRVAHLHRELDGWNERIASLEQHRQDSERRPPTHEDADPVIPPPPDAS